MLRDAEGLSCEAVAEALGLPEGTVKSRLARAREALRARSPVSRGRRATMTCQGVRGAAVRLPRRRSRRPRESRAVAGHLARVRELRACMPIGCARSSGLARRSCRASSPARRSLAARVLDRLEAESAGPGSRCVPHFLAARPLILPSLVPAAFVLRAGRSAAILALDTGPRSRCSSRRRLERDAGVGHRSESALPVRRRRPAAQRAAPRARRCWRGRRGQLLPRDGHRSRRHGLGVTLLEGDSRQARPSSTRCAGSASSRCANAAGRSRSASTA